MTMPSADKNPVPADVGSRQALTPFAAAAGLFSAGMLGAYLFSLHGHPPFLHDKVGYVLGRDFVNTWFYGKAAFLPHPGLFYDHRFYMDWVHKTIPQDICNHLWSYPPSFLLMAAPFGVLPYLIAFTAWTSLGLLAIYLTVRGDGMRTFAIVLAPASVFCLIDGQISLFMAALIISALKLLDRRPVLAGFLVALCTIKPPLGLLWPVLLVVSRRWRTLAAATTGTLLLVLVTGLIWGFDIWRDYFFIGLPAQLADTGNNFAPWSPAIATAVTAAGFSTGVAGLIQIGFTVLAAAIIAAGCATGPMNEVRCALFLACSIFATPYLLSHDLVTVSAVMVGLAAAPVAGQPPGLAIKAMYFLPILTFVAAIWHIPGVALIPVWFALSALKCLRPDQRILRSAMPAS